MKKKLIIIVSIVIVIMLCLYVVFKYRDTIVNSVTKGDDTIQL